MGSQVGVFSKEEVIETLKKRHSATQGIRSAPHPAFSRDPPDTQCRPETLEGPDEGSAHQ
jgi:hypothetical protein